MDIMPSIFMTNNSAVAYKHLSHSNVLLLLNDNIFQLEGIVVLHAIHYKHCAITRQRAL